MSIYEKLAAVQQSLKAPKGQFNAFGKYKYRSCEDILESAKPELARTGATLVISDEIVQIGDRYYIKATARFADGEAAVENTAFAREPEEKKGMDASQITGMASSYARKYALNGLLCIDDTKDADTMDNRAVKQEAQEFFCEKCFGQITDVKKRDGELWTAPDMAEYSKKRFGFRLCADCMRQTAKDEKEAEKAHAKAVLSGNAEGTV